MRVAVVGGGAVGLAISYMLAKAGFKVSLYEASRIFSGASGASLGILSPTLAALDGVDPRRAHEALELHKKLSRELGYSIKSLPIYVPLSEVKAALSEALSAIPAIRWVRIGVGRPGGLGLSLNLGSAFLVDPVEYGEALKKGCVGLGVKISEGLEVKTVKLESRHVEVVFRDASERFDAAVIAAGFRSDEVLAALGLKLGLKPLKGYTVTLEAERRLSYVVGVDPVFIRPHQSLETNIMAGGLKLHSTSASIEEDHVNTILRVVARLGFKGRVSAVRVGIRPCLRKPLESWVAPGVVAAVGHCRNGILLSPIVAARVVKLLEEGYGV